MFAGLLKWEIIKNIYFIMYEGPSLKVLYRNLILEFIDCASSLVYPRTLITWCRCLVYWHLFNLNNKFFYFFLYTRLSNIKVITQTHMQKRSATAFSGSKTDTHTDKQTTKTMMTTTSASSFAQSATQTDWLTDWSRFFNVEAGHTWLCRSQCALNQCHW